MATVKYVLASQYVFDQTASEDTATYALTLGPLFLSSNRLKQSPLPGGDAGQ